MLYAFYCLISGFSLLSIRQFPSYALFLYVISILVEMCALCMYYPLPKK